MAIDNHTSKRKSTPVLDAAFHPVIPRRKSPSPSARKSQAAAMRVYRLRAKNGLQPIKKPWDYLTSQEVKKMAWQAYRVAAYVVYTDLMDPAAADFSHQRMREAFASNLADYFRDVLFAHAVSEGGCWPVTPQTPPHSNYPRIWQMLSDDVASNWRPERPVYPALPSGESQ